MNLYGGDCDIYGRQSYNISFYKDSDDIVQKIINYNFHKTRFTPNDNGELEQISTDLPDLGNKIGNYPVISPDKAKELLYDGKYATSSPTAIKKTIKQRKPSLFIGLRRGKSIIYPITVFSWRKNAQETKA